MKVTFHGVRGSFPVSRPEYADYGGNTSCVEIDTGTATIIIDAGTGIRRAGKELMARGVDEIHLLITHTHWDHIQGLPHFAPLQEPQVTIHLYSLAHNDRQLQEAIAGQQESCFFLPHNIQARLAWRSEHPRLIDLSQEPSRGAEVAGIEGT